MGERKLQVTVPQENMRSDTYSTAERSHHLSSNQRTSFGNMAKSCSQRLANLADVGSVPEKDLITFAGSDFDAMYAMKVCFRSCVLNVIPS